MCKVLIIPSIPEGKQEQAMSFVKTMAPIISVGNKDGLGYAAINSGGDLFGERWFINSQAFKSVVEIPPSELVAKELFGDVGKMMGPTPDWEVDPKNYSMFGVPNLEDVRAITLHARFATSAKGHMNTHPFVDEDTSLIHNGVIRNVDEYELKQSTCDSESILISYLENGMNKDSMQNTIQAVADSLTGYYACGVISRDSDGNRILDVFKANHASLYGTYINELGGVVMSTSAEDIKDACKKLNMTHGVIYEIDSGVGMRFNPLTGELLEKITFKQNLGSRSSKTKTFSFSYEQMSYEDFKKSKGTMRVLKYKGA